MSNDTMRELQLTKKFSKSSIIVSNLLSNNSVYLMAQEAEILKLDTQQTTKIDSAINTTPTGFPSPAQDYFEDSIDIQAYLTPNPTATFYVRYKNDAMNGSGIFFGSILIIDRSLHLKNNNIVLAVLDGNFLVRHFTKNVSGIKLVPSNKKYQPIHILQDMEFAIWGCVSKIITDVDCISRL